MDLKDVLLSLKSRLPDEQVFSTDRPTGQLSEKQLATNCVESVYPVAVFIEWLERVPEAREMLAQYGLGWGVGGTLKRTVTEEMPEVGECAFRARIGDRWQNVKLLDVVGSVIKVRIIGAPVGNMTTIKLDQVSPVDIRRVQAEIVRHPGSAVQTFFDEDDGVTTGEGGLPVESRLSPPPTNETVG